MEGKLSCVSPIILQDDQGFQRKVQCNHCLNCSIRRQLGWTIRICLEGQWSGSSVFTTLTYDEKHKPGFLRYPDVQGYLKRLRKSFPNTVRFFCVGQYGTRSGREHWHLILFGVTLLQMAEKLSAPLKNIPGRGCQGLAELPTKLWPHGSTHIAELNQHRARYAARYSLRTGPRGDEYLVQMSRRPGIGLDAISQIAAYLASKRPQLDTSPGWWRMGGSLYPLDKTARSTFLASYKGNGGTVLYEGDTPLMAHSRARLYTLTGNIEQRAAAVDVAQLERKELERAVL